MKNHVYRPLFAAILLVALILTARQIIVPSDFGVHDGAKGKSFTYNFYRADAVNDWKKWPVSYKGRDYCKECHEENYNKITKSKHKIIQCENCHGPATNHPDNPEKLTIDRSRALCLRCHAELAYPGSHRADLPHMSPDEDDPAKTCVDCHNPHNPNLEDM